MNAAEHDSNDGKYGSHASKHAVNAVNIMQGKINSDSNDGRHGWNNGKHESDDVKYCSDDFWCKLMLVNMLMNVAHTAFIKPVIKMHETVEKWP